MDFPLAKPMLKHKMNGRNSVTKFEKDISNVKQHILKGRE